MNKTLKLVTTATFTALSVVANLFTVPLGNNNAISFTFVLCFLAGVYLGIVPAIAVGYLGDLLAHFIAPHGAYNWFIALSSLLCGVICALVYKLRCHKLVKLTVSSLLWFLICTCLLNTFGLWLQWVAGYSPDIIGLWEFFKADKSGIKTTFWVYWLTRVPYQLINTVVNIAIVATLQQTRALDRVFAKLSPPKTEKPTETGNEQASDKQE